MLLFRHVMKNDISEVSAAFLNFSQVLGPMIKKCDLFISEDNAQGLDQVSSYNRSKCETTLQLLKLRPDG